MLLCLTPPTKVLCQKQEIPLFFGSRAPGWAAGRLRGVLVERGTDEASV